MIFLDTNILVYAAGLHGAADPRTAKAREIMDAGERYAVSLQVIQEFFHATTRSRGESARLTAEEALKFIEHWRFSAIIPVTLELFRSAAALHARYRFSYWDCAIIAAARSAESDILFTEDMQHGQIVDGVQIIDPFRPDT